MLRSFITTLGASAATIYAVLLDRYKHHIEPKGTVLEVIVGELLALAYFRARAPEHLTRREAVALFFESQLVLGTPITLWRIFRAITMLVAEWRERRGG